MALDDILARQGRASVDDPVDYTKVGDGNSLSRFMNKVGPKLAIAGLAAMTGGAAAPLMGSMLGAGSIAAGAGTGAAAGAVGGGLNAATTDGFNSGILSGALRGGLTGALGGGLAAGAGQLANGGNLNWMGGEGNYLQAAGDIAPITAADHARNMAELQLSGIPQDMLQYAPDLAGNYLTAMGDDVVPISGQAHQDNLTELGYNPGHVQLDRVEVSGSSNQPKYLEPAGTDVVPITPAEHAQNMADLALPPSGDYTVERLPEAGQGPNVKAPELSAALRNFAILKQPVQQAAPTFQNMGTIKRGGIDTPIAQLGPADQHIVWQPAGLSQALRR